MGERVPGRRRVPDECVDPPRLPLHETLADEAVELRAMHPQPLELGGANEASLVEDGEGTFSASHSPITQNVGDSC